MMKETIRSAKSLDAMTYSDRMKPFTFTDEGFDSEAGFVPYSDVTKVEKLWAPSGERNGMIRFRVKDRASTRSCDLFYPLEDASRVEQIIPFILSHSDSRFADNTSAQGCPVERPEIKGREQLPEKKGTRDEEDDDLRLPGIGYNFTSRDIPKLQELGDRARRGLRPRLVRQLVLVIGIPAAMILVGKLIVDYTHMAADLRHEVAETIIIVNMAVINCLTIPSLAITWRAMRFLKKNRDGLNPSNAFRYAKIIEGSKYMIEHPWKMNLSAILRKKKDK